MTTRINYDGEYSAQSALLLILMKGEQMLADWLL